MDAQLQAEVNDLIRKLGKLDKATKRERDAILTAASVPLRSAIAAKAPKGKVPHSRYRVNNIRAPKGTGYVVATYQPGNLKKSIKTLKFKRSKAVFIGPKVAREAGSKPDGYYAHMVNDGTNTQPAQSFVEAGIAAAGGESLRLAVKLLRKVIYPFQ